MHKKRKKYMVTAENSEAFACSLVTEPAVEELFVAFNEEKPLIEKFADAKKHMLTGIVAIPNKPIYRRDANGEEYDIVFSKEAIESMAKKFMKNFRQKNVTLQHQEDTDGIYMVEQWVKSDAEHDKSVALGFSKDIPEGTWFQTYYVDSKDVWDRVESGELRGFSLECALGVEEFEKQIFEEQIPDVAPTVEPVEEPVVEEQKTSNEKGILSKILELINGKSQEDAKPTEEPVVEPATEPVAEEPVEEPQTEPEKPNPLEEVVKNLQEEIKTLKETNNGLQAKIKELNKKPSATPTNTNPKGKHTPETGVNSSTYRAWRERMKNMV